MARKKKRNEVNKLSIKVMRFIISVALGLLAVISISLLYDLSSSIKFTLFVGLGVFVLVVFFIDLLTPINLISIKDILGLLPQRKK